VRQDLDRLMRERGLAGLVVLAYDRISPAMYYVTGQQIHYGVYFRSADGRAYLIHDPMERDSAALVGCDHAGFPQHRLPQLFEEEGTYAKAFGRIIGETTETLGIKGPIGLFGDMSGGFAVALVERMRQVNSALVVKDDYPDLLSTARLTKSDDEVEAIRAASRGAVAGMERVRKFLSELKPDGNGFRHNGSGRVTLGDLRRLLHRTFLDNGVAEDGASIVAQGRDAGVPHNHGNDSDELRAGTPILIDIFPGVGSGGYHSDMTRTFCVGKAPQPLKSLYDDVRRAFDSAMGSLKAGELCRDYQERTCDIFEKAGHPTLRSHPGTEEGYCHGLGHGVGLAVHEPPRLGGPPSNKARLEPRMVITVEPGLYYPSRGLGVRIEDLVYVRPDGSMENLTPASYELEVMPRG